LGVVVVVIVIVIVMVVVVVVAGADTKASVNVFEGHSARIRVFKMYGDRLFTASADGTIREWSIKLGQCMNVLRGHEGSVNAISFKGGTLYSAGDDGTIRVWEYSDADPDNPLSEVRLPTPLLPTLRVSYGG
jgi:WD40 repeat protein